ncbi:MAG: CHASE2 domain-containing protein [Candidatus Brocadiia bacterium]
MKNYLQRLLVAVAIGLVGAFVFGYLAAARYRFPELFENRAYDLRMTLRDELTTNRVPQSDKIVFIDIDDFSLLGTEFPLPRDNYRKVIGLLKDAGASVVGFDIILSERAPKNVQNENLDSLHYSIEDIFDDTKINDDDRRGALHDMVEEIRRKSVDMDIAAVSRELGHVYFPFALPQEDTYKDYGEFASISAALDIRAADFSHRLAARSSEFVKSWYEKPSFEDRARVLQQLGAPASLCSHLFVSKVSALFEAAAFDFVRTYIRNADDLSVLSDFFNVEPDVALKRDEELMKAGSLHREEVYASYERIFQEFIYRKTLENFETLRAKTPNLDISTVANLFIRKILADKFPPEMAAADTKIIDAEMQLSEKMLRNYVLMTRGWDNQALAGKMRFGFTTTSPLLYYLESSPRPSYISITPDGDGTIRRSHLLASYASPYGEFKGKMRLYSQMAFTMLLDYLGVKLEDIEVELGHEIRIPLKDGTKMAFPIDEYGVMIVNWVSGDFRDSFKHLSFREVLSQADAPDPEYFAKTLKPAINGKIVLIGLTATGTHDLNPTPLHPRYPMVGLHGNIISNILTGSAMMRVSKWTDFYVTAGVIFLLCLLLPFLPNVASLVWFVVVVGGYLVVSFYLQIGGVWVNAVYVLSGCVVCGVALFAAKYVLEGQSRARLKKIFGVYLSPKLVEQMADQLTEVRLGGVRMSATVYFSDIQGFTSLSEQLPPEKLVDILNRYLTLMTDNILANDGLLDKYVGDAVVAAFGVPFPTTDHAKRACSTALANKAALEKLNVELSGEGIPTLVQRIGLNSGDLVAGNMGSQRRLAYTVMGDTVNLGSRLENVNKRYGTSIIISDTTFEQVRDEYFCRKVDLLRVVGKKKPLSVYELVGHLGQVPEERVAGSRKYEEALEHYLAARFVEARAAFVESDRILGGDKASKEFLSRCDRFIAEPVPPDWDGVWELTEK